MKSTRRWLGVLVALLSLSVAAPSNAGIVTGAVVGGVSWSQPFPGTDDCTNATIHLSATVHGAAIGGNHAAGSISLALSGFPSCSVIASESGLASGSASGAGVSCPALSGSYARVGTALEFMVLDTCVVNGASAGLTAFNVVGHIVPLAFPLSSGLFTGATI